jgi:hypothetical protein
MEQQMENQPQYLNIKNAYMATWFQIEVGDN